VIKAQTGSGKTLAFLLPVIQNLKDSDPPCSHIVIVPTRELATQVYKEVIKYGVDRHSVARRVGGFENGSLRSSPILIATPKRLLKVVEEHSGRFSGVKTVIMDEVDQLLCGSAQKTRMSRDRRPTMKVCDLLQLNKSADWRRRTKTQVVVTSATITEQVLDKLYAIGFTDQSPFIDLTPENGVIPENIKHHHMSVGTSKIRQIISMFKIMKLNSTLVILRGNECQDQAVEEFREQGFNTRALSTQMKLVSDNVFFSDFECGEVQIVVASEEEVRGLDFPFLNTIFLSFVPDHVSNYVHLAGRAGRGGQPARVVTLLNEADYQEELVRYKRMLLEARAKSVKLETRFS